MAKTRFSADLTPDLYEWMMKYADRNKLSRNAVIEKALLDLKSTVKDDVK